MEKVHCAEAHSGCAGMAQCLHHPKPFDINFSNYFQERYRVDMPKVSVQQVMSIFYSSVVCVLRKRHLSSTLHVVQYSANPVVPHGLRFHQMTILSNSCMLRSTSQELEKCLVLQYRSNLTLRKVLHLFYSECPLGRFATFSKTSSRPKTSQLDLLAWLFYPETHEVKL